MRECIFKMTLIATLCSQYQEVTLNFIELFFSLKSCTSQEDVGYRLTVFIADLQGAGRHGGRHVKIT